MWRTYLWTEKTHELVNWIACMHKIISFIICNSFVLWNNHDEQYRTIINTDWAMPNGLNECWVTTMTQKYLLWIWIRTLDYCYAIMNWSLIAHGKLKVTTFQDQNKSWFLFRLLIPHIWIRLCKGLIIYLICSPLCLLDQVLCISCFWKKTKLV